LEDTRNGDNPNYTFGVIFSIPLSRRGPKNAYNISKAEKEQAILRYKKQEQDILVAIENAIGDARNGIERVKASAEASAYAESALQAEQKKLESGKSTSFNVLQLQRDLTERRSDEIRALADYNRALANIAFQEATTLERNHFAVTFK
jgi:HAE1 family hydrophobic/amphiphilic exporter-1